MIDNYEDLRDCIGRRAIRAKWKVQAMWWAVRRVLLELQVCSVRLYRVIRLNPSDFESGSLGPLYLEHPDPTVDKPYENLRCFARIRLLREIAPSARITSSLDWKSQVEIWDKGVEWAVHNLGPDSELPEEHKAVLRSELTYKVRD
jgi:hypothetical protein